MFFRREENIQRKWVELLKARMVEVGTQELTQYHFEFERLEFLGDSILNTYITMKLCESFPNETEGQLSTKKSFLASNAFLKEWTLNSKARETVLPSMDRILLEELSDRMGGSLLEGFVGFMWQARGKRWVDHFLDQHFWPVAYQRLMQGQWHSYRSLVQMLFQKRHHQLPEFQVEETTHTSDEAHRFCARLVFEQEILAVGFGKNKKHAIENTSRLYWLSEEAVSSASDNE